MMTGRRRRALIAAYGAHVADWRSWKWAQKWGPEGSVSRLTIRLPDGTIRALREDLAQMVSAIPLDERPFVEVLSERQIR
jgi:hypothetical protein